MNIVTGEKIQQLCNIYIGFENDFLFNPKIKIEKEKHIYLNLINKNFNNPTFIFCYTHNINYLSKIINFFENDFILVTHNSDGEINQTSEILDLLNSNKLIKWFSQNLLFNHPKFHFLPIGIANSMWNHSNLEYIYELSCLKNLHEKSKKIYFNFSIQTNFNKRNLCYEKLINKIEWLPCIDSNENLNRLSKYQFCICPEGNGVDTHRLWECLYLKVVPIVIKTNFSNILLKYSIPIVVLDNWDSLDINNLNYEDYNFYDELFLKILNFNSEYLINKL